MSLQNNNHMENKEFLTRKINEYTDKLKISSERQTFYQVYLKNIILDNSEESKILIKGCKHFIMDFSAQCKHNKNQIKKWSNLLNKLK